MPEQTYELAYQDADQLIAEVGPLNFTQGRRITLKIGDGSEYVFTYIDARGDRINGLSAARAGNMVVIDLEAMTLTEQQPSGS